MAGFNPSFNFGGMDPSDAEASLRLFATEVLPVLHSWHTEPLAEVGATAGLLV